MRVSEPKITPSAEEWEDYISESMPTDVMAPEGHIAYKKAARDGLDKIHESVTKTIAPPSTVTAYSRFIRQLPRTASRRSTVHRNGFFSSKKAQGPGRLWPITQEIASADGMP